MRMGAKVWAGCTGEGGCLGGAGTWRRATVWTCLRLIPPRHPRLRGKTALCQVCQVIAAGGGDGSGSAYCCRACFQRLRPAQAASKRLASPPLTSAGPPSGYVPPNLPAGDWLRRGLLAERLFHDAQALLAYR